MQSRGIHAEIASSSIVKEAVRRIVLDSPHEAKALDDEGNTPLHAIFLHGRECREDIFDALLAAYPEAREVCNNDSFLPLHLAIKNGTSTSILLQLITPLSATARTYDNNLPLHYALRSRCALAVAQQLFDLYPAGATLTDKEGQLPIHIAVKNGFDADFIQQLLQADWPLLENGSVRVGHKHSWSWLLNNAIDPCPQIVHTIVENNIVYLRNLAELRDEQGRLVLDNAPPSIRSLFTSRHPLALLLGKYRIDDQNPIIYSSDTALVLLAHEIHPETTDLTAAVAIKCFHRECDYQRDQHCRTLLHNSPTVLQVLSRMDPPLFTEEIRRTQYTRKLPALISCRAAIILPYSTWTLKSIWENERPSAEETRRLLQQVVTSVAELHDSGVVHGDINWRNFIRHEGRLYISDFDSSVSLAEGTAMGSKLTTGVLPPEMFYTFSGSEDSKRYAQYWGSTGISSRHPRWKLAPALTSAGMVVPRCYTEERPEVDILPYPLLPPSFAVDTWALGVLVFSMLSVRGYMLPLDREDNLASTEGLLQAIRWRDLELDILIAQEISSPVARDLLRALLRVLPQDRLTPAFKILEHPYFSQSPGSSPTQSRQEKEKHMIFLRRREVVAMRTVAPAKLSDISQSYIANVDNIMRRTLFGPNAFGFPFCFTLTASRLEAASTQAEISSLDKVAARAWLQRVCVIGRMLSKTDVEVDKIDGLVMSLFTETLRDKNNVLYLYLVDEITMRPLLASDDSMYPIKLNNTNVKALRKLFPLWRLSQKCVYIAKGTGALSGCFGVPSAEMQQLSSDAYRGLKMIEMKQEFSLLSGIFSPQETSMSSLTVEMPVPAVEVLEDLFLRMDFIGACNIFKIRSSDNVCWSGITNVAYLNTECGKSQARMYQTKPLLQAPVLRSSIKGEEVPSALLTGVAPSGAPSDNSIMADSVLLMKDHKIPYPPKIEKPSAKSPNTYEAMVRRYMPFLRKDHSTS